MNNYVVSFCDNYLTPWIKIFNSSIGISDIEDKVMMYVLDNFEFDSKLPVLYSDFKEAVRTEGLYIGKIELIDD